jgi:hypothetical protein
MKELEEKYQRMNSILQNLLDSFSLMSEPAKQSMAKELIQKGVFQ